MIFDQLCGLVERHIPAFVPILQKTHLFVFPYSPQEVLPKGYTDDEIAFLAEHFFLPFPAVVVEDHASCVVLWDTVEDQQGFDRERYFMECVPLDYDHLKSWLPEEQRAGVEAALKDGARVYDKGTYQITFGKVTDAKAECATVSISGFVSGTLTATKREALSTLADWKFADHDFRFELTQETLRSVNAAYEELVLFNSPSRFVVEKSSARALKPNPNVKVPRSDARSHFILLTPDEIRTTFAADPSTGVERGSPTPHQRRRHFRRLTSERYREARGRTITIPATWVGPQEAVVGPNRYRVRVDL